MGKFLIIVSIIMTIASLIYSASLKTCETKMVKGLPVEMCEPSSVVGKFVKDNFGITL